MKWFACTLLAVLTLSVSMLGGQGQDSPPVFRSAVNLVQVDVSVTDADGNPVTGLTVNDFEVREDGRPQSITQFLSFDIPIENAREGIRLASSAESDVQTNELREGRLYVFAVDDLRPENGLRARLFLRRFVEQYMGEADLAAVVLVGHGRRIDTQEFTTNRRLLLRAIDLISGWPGLPSLNGAGFSMGDPQARMLALQDLVAFLAHVPSRRKAVVLLAEDVGVDVQNAIDTPLSASVATVAGDIAREMARTAIRANVSFYPIDPNRLSVADVVSGAGEAAPSIEMDRVRRDLEMRRRTNLQALAAVTGGVALVSSNNVDSVFDRIVRQNSSYYLLGYSSTQTKADGKFRRLNVRVKRPGLQVRTVDGYLAPKERLAEPPRRPGVIDALSNPLGVSGLPMRVVAGPYRGQGDEAVVATAIEVNGDALEFEKKGDAYTAELEVGYVVSGATSVTAPVSYRMDFTLKPDSYEKAHKNGIRILLEPRIRPGIYQLRLAVTQLGRRSGSVVYDLEVPDFAKKPITLSAVSLTSVETSGLHVSSGKNMLLETLPGPMTAVRQFSSTDRVAMYAEVYDNIGSTNPHTVAMRAELRTETGAAVKTISTERSSAQMQNRQGGYGLLGEMTLDGVTAGAYVLHVEAAANVADRPTDSRDVPIRVR